MVGWLFAGHFFLRISTMDSAFDIFFSCTLAGAAADLHLLPVTNT